MNFACAVIEGNKFIKIRASPVSSKGLPPVCILSEQKEVPEDKKKSWRVCLNTLIKKT